MARYTPARRTVRTPAARPPGASTQPSADGGAAVYAATLAATSDTAPACPPPAPDPAPAAAPIDAGSSFCG